MEYSRAGEICNLLLGVVSVCRHPREGGDLKLIEISKIPAFAGMTIFYILLAFTMKENLEIQLQRIADALERMYPPALENHELDKYDAFVWSGEKNTLSGIKNPHFIKLSLLKGIDHVKDILFENTYRFSQGHGANNALLWGARGMGKSSAVKAVCAEVNRKNKHALCLVEILRDDLQTLPELLQILEKSKRRFIIFCDDLSFDKADSSYKHLKVMLEGGIRGRPANVLFYATSNQRHLLPRDMAENEKSTAISPHEMVEEKVSLSDRFGLWLGFHGCSQEIYFQIVESYARAYKLKISATELRAKANEWAITRGARSGRVARQFIDDLAGELGL